MIYNSSNETHIDNKCLSVLKSHKTKYIHKGVTTMTNNELELINIVRESVNPEQVANYMFSLFLDYLRTHAPSQETPVVVPLEFV